MESKFLKIFAKLSTLCVLLLLSVFLLCDFSPEANAAIVDSGTCGAQGDNLTWTIDDQGTLTISGSGAMKDWTYGSYTPWYSHRSSIKNVTIGNSVTTIGDHAFQYCKSLTSATIPDSVTTIGIRAFHSCSSLTSITIPDSVTTIGMYAFRYCSGLKSVTIGEGIESIEVWAFADCDNLKEVYYNAVNSSAVEAFGDSGLTGIKVRIGAKVTRIPGSLFCASIDDDNVTEWAEDSARSGVVEVVFEDGSVCRSIGESAFKDCRSLEAINLPASVAEIGSYAFDDCRSLQELTIPVGVTTIGDFAFKDCDSLREITFEGDAPSIGTNAFYGVTASASHPENNKTWTSAVKQSYGGLIYWNGNDAQGSFGDQGDNLTWTLDDQGTLTISGTGAMPNWSSKSDVPWYFNCSSIKKAIIGEGVTTIGNYTFYNCTGLTSVTIPASVTSIGDHAFYNCIGLTGVYISDVAAWCTIDFYGYYSNPLFYAEKLYFNNELVTDLVIPDGVTTIGDYAFYNCTGLTSVTIPASVTTIGRFVFYACTGLAEVYINDLKAWCEFGFYYYAQDGWDIYLDYSYSNPLFYAKKLYLNNQLVTELVIPDGVTLINLFTFYGFDGFTSVTIPDSVTTIGEYAFDSCNSLKSVTIGEGVTTIGNYAFLSCNSLHEITFEGNAPSIGTNAFYGVTAAAYHPYLDASWTEKVCQNYGGNITWQPVAPMNDPNFKFAGASLSLQHNIAVNFKADKALFETGGFTDPYVVFEMNGAQVTVEEYVVSGNRYIFTFKNIAPNCMNDTISATMYATKDGDLYASATRTYSVAEYCYSMLELYSADQYAELRTLLVDLLNYGAASQWYTNYNTDNLVNGKLTAAQKQWGTAETPELTSVLNTAYETVENPKATWRGAGLQLNDAVSVRLTFRTDNAENLKVIVKTDKQQWTLGADEFVENNGTYYVYFNGLHAGQMRETFYITIYEGDTAVSNTASYSIESYANRKLTVMTLIWLIWW